MNYLVHLYLCDADPDHRLGTLMGDFVKGRLLPDLPAGLARGIEHHRQVDSFAHRNEACRRSKGRIDPAFGHCRAIMVDIFYDHFMARQWQRHAGQPLPPFAREIYTLLEENFSRLPPGLQTIAPRMIAHDWLTSYQEERVVGRVLERLAARLRYPNRMAEGLPELQRNYRELEGDFEEFLAAAVVFFRPQ